MIALLTTVKIAYHENFRIYAIRLRDIYSIIELQYACFEGIGLSVSQSEEIPLNIL